MVNQKGVMLVSVLLLAIAFSALVVSAVTPTTLFEDTFNDNNLAGWSAAYFGSADGNVWFDVGTDNDGTTYDSYYAWVEDDAAVYKWVNTTGYQNISFSYCRRTAEGAGGSDRLRIGWKTGSSSTNWGNWNELESVLTSTWSCKNYNLSSSTNDGGVWIAFFLDDGENEVGRVDNVLLTGMAIPTGPTPDTTAPVCSIDYLKQKYSGNEYSFTSNPIYFSETGRFYIHGSSEDEASNVVEVQFNRSDIDAQDYWTWDDAAEEDGAFNEWEEGWKTDFNDNTFNEGDHQVCCRVTDAAGNNHDTTVGDENPACVDFCIDTQDPTMTSLSDNTYDCSAEGKYWNDNSITWSWTASDTGCAGINYYIVRLYQSGEEGYDLIETSDPVAGNSWTYSSLEDGETYYITVTPYDKAENEGNSMQSAYITIDTTSPEVTIDSIWGSVVPYDGNDWITGAFYVNETDDSNDDETLTNCSITVSDESGSHTWSVACNQPAAVSNSYCTVDGEGACKITKTATDRACNVDSYSNKYNVDKHAPETTKTPQGNYYNDTLTYYMSQLIHYFLGSTSGLGFTGVDEGVGCNQTFVEVRDSQNILVDSFYFNGCNGMVSMVEEYADGVYTVTYYSVDYLGNTENATTETDKIDTLAPETTKTYDLFVYGWRNIPVFNNLETWMRFISPETNISLIASDTEVGQVVEPTSYYQIQVPSKEDASLCGQMVTQTDNLFVDNFESDLTKWDAEYWESHDDGNIGSDYGIGDSDTSPAGGDYLWLEDDASLYAQVDTTGHSNIVFSYYRRTAYAENPDRLEVSWKEGEYCNPYDVCGGDSWDVDGDGLYGCSACEWHNLEQAYGPWNYASFTLPEEAEDTTIQVAFWLDDGEADVGRVDGVVVTGDKEVPAVTEGHCEWYGDSEKTWYESEEDCTDAENEECTATIWAEDQMQTYCDSPVGQFEAPYTATGLWCVYDDENKIQVEESEHKICYFSADELDNVEDVECQVFSVDGTEPTVYILNPSQGYAEGNLGTACVMPLTIILDDEKVGISEDVGDVYAVLFDGDTEVGRYTLTRGIVLEDGSERWFYPNSVDLTGLSAGDYTLRIYASDKLGNVNNIETRGITLDEGIFVPANWVKGCEIGTSGGLCNVQFTACARGVTHMDFAMTKLLDQDGEDAIELAGLDDLDATIHTAGGSGYVGEIDWMTGLIEPKSPGQVVPLKSSFNCGEVINGRVNFNLTLNFNQALVNNIGTGSYYFDWQVGDYSNPVACDVD